MKSFYYKEIIEYIPESKLDDFGESAEVDYKVSKLIGKDIFNLFLYSILEKDELSLRTI